MLEVGAVVVHEDTTMSSTSTLNVSYIMDLRQFHIMNLYQRIISRSGGVVALVDLFN